MYNEFLFYNALLLTLDTIYLRWIFAVLGISTEAMSYMKIEGKHQLVFTSYLIIL